MTSNRRSLFRKESPSEIKEKYRQLCLIRSKFCNFTQAQIKGWMNVRIKKESVKTPYSTQQVGTGWRWYAAQAFNAIFLFSVPWFPVVHGLLVWLQNYSPAKSLHIHPLVPCGFWKTYLHINYGGGSSLPSVMFLVEFMVTTCHVVRSDMSQRGCFASGGSRYWPITVTEPFLICPWSSTSW